MSEALERQHRPQAPPPLGATPLARWLAPTSESRLERIACAEISPRPWPAHPDDDDRLVALVRSIRERGVVEPLLLRPAAAGRFEVVLGARRLQAARRAGLAEVPAIVRALDDAEATLLAAWSLLHRLRPGEMVEMAARLAAAGVTEAEAALLLGTVRPPSREPDPPEWPLLGGSSPLRFAGAGSPANVLLHALGDRRAALLALRGSAPAGLC